MIHNLESQLKKLWAKSDGTSIRDHTDTLLENLRNLRELFGSLIENNLPEDKRDLFWKALELACEYHDYGKIYPAFQGKLGNPEFKRAKEPEVRHNLLSPAFLPKDLEDPIKTLVALAIVHHHEYSPSDYREQDVIKALKSLNLELESYHKKVLIQSEEDILKRLEDWRKFYLLLKGFLLRIDHASSSKVEKVEVKRLENTPKCVRDYLNKEKGSDLNHMQRWVLENRDKNLLLLASTGMGKTEAGFIYLEGKGFFTVPIRTSVNAIYERAKEVFGKEDIGLLHSTASVYLLENLDNFRRNTDDIRRNTDPYSIIYDIFLTRNFAKPLIVATPDQLFPFVFRFKGFEKYYALFSYSGVVVDELQLFEPFTLGYLVMALQKAQEIGGKFLVMTATLPSFVREDLKDLNYLEEKFFYPRDRHHLKLIRDSILSDYAIELIGRLSSEGKVLVVVNTRRRAIDLFEKLKEKGFENLNLLHSYYTWNVRKEKEKEIRSFFDSTEKGIWICTQIAEVSLDLDADILLTELSTADSLIQRMGRVNRRSLKPVDKPNVYIFTEDCSGIGPVYRRSLYELTKEKLREGIISEEEKFKLVEEVYELLEYKDKKYLDEYREAKRYIKSLWSMGETFNKKEAMGLFRDIDSVTVIPEKYREEVEELIKIYRDSRDILERLRVFSDILGYTFSVPRYAVKARIRQIEELRGMYWLSGYYDEELGYWEPSKEEKGSIDNVL